MTSPHVSEQEVEAAATALCLLAPTFSKMNTRKDWEPHARAALTAAAQVRERAGVYLCRMPGGIHGGSCPTCGCEVIAAGDPSAEPDSGPDVLGERKE